MEWNGTEWNGIVRMYVCMHGWMDGWMHGQIDGWMDGWVDGCMDIMQWNGMYVYIVFA